MQQEKIHRHQTALRAHAGAWLPTYLRNGWVTAGQRPRNGWVAAATASLEGARQQSPRSSEGELRKNSPKTAGKQAQNGDRGSEWAAVLLKLVSEGSCAGRSHWAGRKVGVLGCFGMNFSNEFSLDFLRGEFRARPLDRHATAA